jgi:glyoxylase-like metal-dependent hydrolase (beta-lactamase superfamily II)
MEGKVAASQWVLALRLLSVHVCSKHCYLSVIGQSESIKATVTDITKDVADQLTAASVPLSSINSIIWSHHHVDHIGDPSLFPKSTSLVVGPGFKSNKKTYPGYPLNPEAIVCQDAFDGRDLIELDFGQEFEIGGFKAMDFFGDGSFYLLQASGHS